MIGLELTVEFLWQGALHSPLIKMGLGNADAKKVKRKKIPINASRYLWPLLPTVAEAMFDQADSRPMDVFTAFTRY